MDKFKKYSQSYLGLLLVAFASITAVAIAYAALSSALTITTNKITQKGISWNVAFDTSNTTVNGNGTGTSTTGITCGAATVTTNSITIADTTLAKPDDKCVWDFTIKNTGTIAAVLNSVTGNQGSTTCTVTNASTSDTAKMVCDKITYTITDTSGGNILTGSTLAASTGTQPVRLTAQYTDNTATPTAVNQTGMSFTFEYIPE